MKQYHSEFSPEVSSYLFQQLEYLQSYLTSDALMLLEEVTDPKYKRLVLKIKDNDVLYKIDSSAETLELAMVGAKDKAIELIVKRKNTDKVLPKIENWVVYH